MEELHTWYYTIHRDKKWASIQIITDIEKNLRLVFVPESINFVQNSVENVCMANSLEVRDVYKNTFTPFDLLDYMYAIINSTKYRVSCKNFTIIDFSKVPFPKHAQDFWSLVSLGHQLQRSPQSKTHLLILIQRIDTYETVCAN